MKYTPRKAEQVIDLSLVNYKMMKKYLTNSDLKFEVQQQQQPLRQIAQLQAPQSGFVQANGLVAKKRFQPPTKTGQSQQHDKPEDEMVKRIESEIIESADKTTWQDIAGLDHVRDQVMEIAIWPLENPLLFEGIISPGSGLLLFGPPGTGKTMIGKAIANEGKATFFSIKASSLTSKYVGEGEKLVRTLFQLASQRQPSVIFFDEIDSLLCARSEKENEASRQIKTEFMVQMEGASTKADRIVFIGATNRPQELDEAIKRRFQKKIYIPLPNHEGRLVYFKQQLLKARIDLNDHELNQLVEITKGYSGADLRNLSREACMNPVREAVKLKSIREIDKDQIRPTKYYDFEKALAIIKPTVNRDDLHSYLNWNQQHGSYNYNETLLST